MFEKTKNLIQEEDFGNLNIPKSLKDAIEDEITYKHIASYLTLSESVVRSPFAILGLFEEEYKNGRVSELINDNHQLAFIFTASAMYGTINKINQGEINDLFALRMKYTVNHLAFKYKGMKGVKSIAKLDTRRTFMEMFTVKGFYEPDESKRMLGANAFDLLKELSAIGINAIYYWKNYYEKEGREMDLFMAIVISAFGDFFISKPRENKVLLDAHEILGEQSIDSEIGMFRKDLVSTFMSILEDVEKVVPDIESIVKTAHIKLSTTISDHDENDRDYGPKDDDFE